MAFQSTTTFYKVPNLDIRYREGALKGVNAEADDATAAMVGYYRLWTETPTAPGKYYTLIQGALVINDPVKRVEQINHWEVWPVTKTRGVIKDRAYGQKRSYTDVQHAEDSTLKWNTDLDGARYKSLVEQLALTPDNALEAFDTDLFAYEAAAPDYAQNMIKQETANLSKDTELVAASGEGLFTESERTAIKARITENTKVVKGTAATVLTPTRGAPRELVTKDKEKREGASFFEIAHDDHTFTMYHPKCVLDAIPAGEDPAKVFLTVYNNADVYLGTLPFTQRSDGKWETGNTTSGLASNASTTWRCAISNGHASADYEITARVYVVPPNSSWAWTRWDDAGAPTKKDKKDKND